MLRNPSSRPYRNRQRPNSRAQLNAGGQRLGDALRACASGFHPLEAGAGLLIDCGSWLHREDFTSRFITAHTSVSDGVTLLASTYWEAAVTALNAAQLPAADAPPGCQHRRRNPGQP